MPAEVDARAMAEEVLQAGLAGAANILPGVQSLYQWQGSVLQRDEKILYFKSLESNFTKLQDVIKKHHPDQIPSIVAVPIAAGNLEYLAWLMSEAGD